MQGRIPPIGGSMTQDDSSVVQNAATSPVAPQPNPSWTNPPALAQTQRAVVFSRPTLPYPSWMYT